MGVARVTRKSVKKLGGALRVGQPGVVKPLIGWHTDLVGGSLRGGGLQRSLLSLLFQASMLEKLPAGLLRIARLAFTSADHQEHALWGSEVGGGRPKVSKESKENDGV